MSPFELSQAVENLKVFFTNFSDLDGRYDPEFYRSREKLIKNFFYPLDKISNSFFIKDGDHDKLPVDAISDELEGKRYLRSQDLKNNEIISANPVYVSSEYFKKMSRCHIYAGDLLFSIMASVGATAIVPNGFPSCMANRAVGILRPKKYSRFLPEYVQVLFNSNVGMALINIQKRGGIQQRINLADIGQLRMPVPDENIQKKIIDIYSNALNLKKEKEVASQSLLDSIDTYLLNELGIIFPRQDNSLDERMFFSSVKDVSGGRFDSDFHRVFYKDLTLELLKKTKVEKIKDISLAVFQGVGKDEVSFSEFKLLKVKNIKQNNEIDFSEIEYIKHVPHRKILCFNDIISPFIGEAIKQYKFSSFVERQGKYTVDNNTGVIRINTSLCNPIYVCDILNSVLVKFQIDRYLGGGGVPFLGASRVKEILIPIVPIEKQNEIAAHIQSIREQAAELQREAVQILEDAKVQIERMILGDSEV
ncbi:restriction endonuclease subunit S [Thiothrix subterranea]|uniref:Restriction endonuclease subunit S n=1 Tax=Thiothrix subterranea TaxID=2735563 RepID=A0AA51MPC4_9GAMM|nr:restriction endonuclease subunit S [Thiothrix subterranea]MDQ5768491.1 restriction endonuclease subunit S [Thiothrix subterranea]WML87628.1 restriction endonuclease subunit S [Thiothrix subterranea]